MHGNHDLVTREVLNTPEMFQVKDGSTSILFFHGHQLDPLVESWWVRNFDTLGIWSGGWLERIGLDITKKMNFESKMKAINDAWPVGGFEKMAAAFGRTRKCDIVVTGHSHHPMKVEIGNSLFLNSGTRVSGRQDLIIIDTEAHQYDVHKSFVIPEGDYHNIGDDDRGSAAGPLTDFVRS